MITSRERLIILYLLSNDNKFEIYNLCLVLDISERTLRRSVDIIKHFINKHDKNSDLQITNNQLTLKIGDLNLTEKLKSNNFYEYSKIEISIIFANSLLATSVTNFQSYVTLFGVTKQHLKSIIKELEIHFAKQNIKILSNGQNLYLSNKDLVGIKRVKLNILNSYLKLLPEIAIVDIEKYVPHEVCLIINDWLYREDFRKLHKNISKSFRSLGLFISFYEVFYLCMILILWKDFKNNAKYLNANSMNLKELSKNYKLLDFESETFNKYFLFSQMKFDKDLTKLVDDLMRTVFKIYKPFNEERKINLKKDICLILTSETTEHTKVRYVDFKKEINDLKLSKLYDIFGEVLSCSDVIKRERLDYVGYLITKNVYYWILEQITMDPFNLLFVQNDTTTTTNYFLTMINNSFCCVNLEVINIYEFSKELYERHDITVSQLKLNQVIKRYIFIKENNFLQINKFISEIQEQLMDKAILSYDNN